MYYQVTLRSERFLTKMALNGSFSRVASHVPRQMTRYRKSFMTYIASVWLFSRMDQDVFLEITGATERLIADVTGVHLCSCGSQVDALNRWLLWFTGGCVGPLATVVHRWMR